MEELVQPQMGLNFEQVWAALQKTGRLIRELRDEGKETDQRMKETDRRMKELQKSMGELGNRFGELAEHLVIPNIIQKFNALHYHFKETSKERKFHNPETGRVEAEFDILLENTTYSIGVEVKTKPAEKDVSEHIRRLEFLRRYKDQEGDKREIRGAIAGAIMPEEVNRLWAQIFILEKWLTKCSVIPQKGTSLNNSL